MSLNISLYWRLHILNAWCQHKIISLTKIQDFLKQHTFELNSNRQLQTHLFDLSRNQNENSFWAYIGLRCYISAIIYFECLDKAAKYGAKHQFRAEDLFPLLLDTKPTTLKQNSYQSPTADISLTSKILDNFDPTKGSLSTYTKLHITGWPELKDFFLQKGLIEVTDWNLLCKRTPSSLSKILKEFEFPFQNFSVSLQSNESEYINPGHYYHTSQEIREAVSLLNCFHDVYRIQRTENTTGRRYLPPTKEQFIQMSKRLKLSEAKVQNELLVLAQKIRHYVIHFSSSRSKEFKGPKPSSKNKFEWFDEHIPPYLNLAVEETINKRYQYFKKKSKKKAQQYLQALRLYYCQSLSIRKIALQLSLSRTTVSMMVNRNAFEEDICIHILAHAAELLKELLPSYTPEELEKFFSYLLDYLNDMKEIEEINALTSQNRNMTSLFARTVCQSLDQ